MAGITKIAGLIQKKINSKARRDFLRLALPVFALSLVVVATGCSTTNSYVHEKSEPDFVSTNFAALRTNIMRVTVMPPSVKIVRQRFWREHKASAQENAAVSAQLQRLVEDQLRYAGFTVQAQATNNFLPAEALGSLNQWLTNSYWSSSPEGPGAPTTKALADAAHADALVCVRYARSKTTWQRYLRGYHTTAASWVGAVAGAGGVLAGIYFSHSEGMGGEAAAGLTVLGGAAGFFLFKETSWLITGGGDPEKENLPNRAVLGVALVDGQTGEVLWTNATVVESGDKDLESMTATVFRNFLK